MVITRGFGFVVSDVSPEAFAILRNDTGNLHAPYGLTVFYKEEEKSLFAFHDSEVRDAFVALHFPDTPELFSGNE